MSDPSTSRQRGRRLQTAMFLLGLLVLAGVTAGGYLGVKAQERSDEREAADEAAATAASSTETIVRRALDALGGASAVVGPDGSLDTAAFVAYANDVLAGSASESLALLAYVAGEDRASFEAFLGVPITARTTGDNLVPAPAADRYFPVVLVQPPTGGFRVPGFDYGSVPERAVAVSEAIARHQPVASAPTTLSGSGVEGIILVHPIYPRGEPTAEPAGLVASSLTSSELAVALGRALPPSTAFRITDEGRTVAGSGSPSGPRARSMELEVSGRSWVVLVEPPAGPERSLPTLVLIFGSAIEVGLLGLFIVTSRHQRRLGRANRSLVMAERRSRTLERLASRLSRSLSGVEVASALLDGLPGLTGALGGAVAVLTDDREQLELVAGAGYTPDQLARLERVTIEDDSAMARVILDAEPQWLPSPLSWRNDAVVARYAEISNATALIPLVHDDVLGVLAVCQPGVRRFSDDERSLLVTIGALAGRALDRSLRYDAEHATAVAFQRASLPHELPPTEGASIAARYRPATSTASVGGDWYDVLSLGDGRIAVTVGDVVGHGVTAAAVMGQLRAAVRVLAAALPDPATLLQSLSAQVSPIPDALGATMAYGVVDPVAGTFEFVRAGHLPPLVLRAAGGAELVPSLPSPPLGVSFTTTPVATHVDLRPGDTLVLYTDGVVERRGESLALGLERLRATGLELGDLEPEDLCDALLEAIVPADDQADDVAVLVIRLAAAPASRPPAVEEPAVSEPSVAGARAHEG